jgi:hypothetical protein
MAERIRVLIYQYCQELYSMKKTKALGHGGNPIHIQTVAGQLLKKPTTGVKKDQ